MSSALTAYVSAPHEVHTIRIKVGGVLHVVCRVHDVVFLMLCLGDGRRVVVGVSWGMCSG